MVQDRIPDDKGSSSNVARVMRINKKSSKPLSFEDFSW